MPKQCSIAAARDRFTSLIHEAEKGERVELTRRGKPVAILISLDEYRRLTRERRSFWEAYEEYRARYADSEIDTDGVFDDVRDPSPGRSFSW